MLMQPLGRPHRFLHTAAASVFSDLRERLTLLLLGLALGGASPSWAASVPTTASFMARANIVRGCLISATRVRPQGLGLAPWTLAANRRCRRACSPAY